MIQRYMHKAILGLITLFLTHAAFASYSAKIANHHFIEKVTQHANVVNQEITNIRGKVSTLKKQATDLSKTDRVWLQNLALKYGLKRFSSENTQDWSNLLSRINIIPTQLVVAQAALESNWGKSRFAREGNNYFGMRCYSVGCGIIPKNRAKGAHFEVTKFKSTLASIKSYIHTLNTHKNYQKLRTIRAQLSNHELPITATALSSGLSTYSEIGKKYVSIVNRIIKQIS